MKRPKGIYEDYKPFRNWLRRLDRLQGLIDIWCYSQHVMEGRPAVPGPAPKACHARSRRACSGQIKPTGLNRFKDFWRERSGRDARERYRPALTPIGSVARQFLHHFSTASYVTIQGHARGICFRVNGHIAGARSGRSQPTKEDTSTKADDSNNNNDSPFME